MIPGLGSSVADWFAYGHARATEKGAEETFGKGDVRGVIAVDSATNAKEGGSLIPTLAFGIPGSSTLAFGIRRSVDCWCEARQRDPDHSSRCNVLLHLVTDHRQRHHVALMHYLY